MINKKLILLLVFLLVFLLHVSFVSAESNETDTIEINDNEISANNISDYSADSLDYDQGDKIPININSPVKGNLTVLIDDEFYEVYSFSNNGTILISTFNPDSFFNPSIKNIDVGTHKISLIFDLNSFNNYVPVVYRDDFNLKFEFNKYGEDVLDNTYKYSFDSILNIYKKERTIHVSFDMDPIYYFAPVSVTIKIYDIDEALRKNKNPIYSVGILISDGEDILLKKVDVFDKTNYVLDYDEGGVPYVFVCAVYELSGIDYEVENKLGVCNLTVVNFADGTSDSVLFEISKFETEYPDEIKFTVNESDVTFYFCQYIVKGFVGIEDMEKIISFDDCEYYWNITFSNLNPGKHILRLYYPESDVIKQFSYNISFEIKDFYHNDLPDSVNIIGNNVSFNMFPNLDLIENNAFLFFNSGSGIFDVQEIVIDDNSGLSDSEDGFNGNLKITGKSQSSVGDNAGEDLSGSSSHRPSTKAHEISKKSVSKSTDNILARLGITIISCMLFMVGYVKFEKT